MTLSRTDTVSTDASTPGSSGTQNVRERSTNVRNYPSTESVSQTSNAETASVDELIPRTVQEEDNLSQEDAELDSVREQDCNSEPSDGEFSTIDVGLDLFCHLRTDHCRCPMTLTVKNGSTKTKMQVVCGKPLILCKRHHGYRTSGRPRYEVGYYRTFQGHGEAGGVFYTEEQMQTIKDREQARIDTAVRGQQEDIETEEESELVDLTRDLRRVEIGGSTILETSPSAPPREAPTDQQQEQPRQSPPRRGVSNIVQPTYFYGLEDPRQQLRLITHCEKTSRHLQRSGYELRKIFVDVEAGDKWVDETFVVTPPHRSLPDETREPNNIESLRNTEGVSVRK